MDTYTVPTSENDLTIPYAAHEGIVARMERANRRSWILCIVLIILLAVTNGAWIYYDSQFIDESYSVIQELDTDGGGDAIIYDGVRINGTSEANRDS